MSTFAPGLPQLTEYHSGFSNYVGKARSFSDPLQKLTEQLDEVLALLGPLDAVAQLYRYAPEKWSVKQILGHLTDTERIFAYRALRIARTDETPMAGFDENRYAGASEVERCDWKELLEEFEHVRRASILMLRHLPQAGWTRTGTANEAPMSVRALAYIMIGHVAHHLEILRERYGLR